MVDMFFYRDPEEVEKQQQEEAAAKLALQQGTEEAAPTSTEWDVAAAPQAGGINPALVAQEGTRTHLISVYENSTLLGGALDWSAEPAASGDWAAEPAGATGTGGWGAEEATGWN